MPVYWHALYTAKQVQKGRPKEAQVPERSVVEVKGVGDDVWLPAKSDQLSRYWGPYQLVLIANPRDFVLVGTDGSSGPASSPWIIPEKPIGHRAWER